MSRNQFQIKNERDYSLTVYHTLNNRPCNMELEESDDSLESFE